MQLKTKQDIGDLIHTKTDGWTHFTKQQLYEMRDLYVEIEEMIE